MGRKSNETAEMRYWKMAGRMGGHLIVGWMLSNIMALFVSPIVWMDLEYVRQIPLVPFLLMTVAGTMVSWFLERKKGDDYYNVKKKAGIFIAVYLLMALLLALVDMFGINGNL